MCSKNGGVKDNPFGNPALDKYQTEHMLGFKKCGLHTLTQLTSSHINLKLG